MILLNRTEPLFLHGPVSQLPSPLRRNGQLFQESPQRPEFRRIRTDGAPPPFDDYPYWYQSGIWGKGLGRMSMTAFLTYAERVYSSWSLGIPARTFENVTLNRAGGGKHTSCIWRFLAFGGSSGMGWTPRELKVSWERFIQWPYWLWDRHDLDGTLLATII